MAPGLPGAAEAVVGHDFGASVASLAARGLDAGTVATLHGLFQACNEARYAPHSTTQELTAMAARVESALAAIGALEERNAQ